MISGAQAMVECLRQEKVDVLFGYPGAAIAPFYDSLSRADDIRHILTRTEQGAGHAANGYARVANKPGVCVATSGPGATNLLTALATAYSDSIPMVALTGQAATCQLGHDVFQEVDATGAAAPFIKYAYLVKSPEDLGRVFKEAFHIASTGRKGPVLIDVPVDVQRAQTDFSYPHNVHLRGYKPRFDGHVRQVRKVAQAISCAKRPLLCCGGGVHLSGATEQVRKLCEEAKLPAVSTLMGVGALPPKHPAYFGMLGQSGLKTANIAVSESDLLLLIGARVGDRAIVQPNCLESNTTIIHIDIDATEIGKNVDTTIPIVGDAARILEQLMACGIRGEWMDWTARLDAMRKADLADLPAPSAENRPVEPNAFVRLLCSRLPENAVYVADVGQNQIWSARNYTANGRFLTSGGMGTMGYAIPAAIGAKLASPDRCVLAVCGDGAFQMSMNELATVNQHRAPVKIVVVNNGKLGMIREIQHDSYGGKEFAVDLSGGPAISGIAAAYHIPYARADNMNEAGEGVSRMLAENGPFLLELMVDPEEATL